MTNALTPKNSGHDENWRGYTIDELRMRRAYVKVRLEMEKAQLFSHSRSVVKGGVLPMGNLSRSIFGKVIGALDYFDYAYIAYRTGGRLLHIFRSLHRHKKTGKK